MKKLFFILLLFSSSLALAQASMKWEQAIGGTGVDIGYRVRSCMDQGYIVAGSTASNGISDGYIVRTDSLGLIMWSKYYVGNNVDIFRSIRQLPDSGYILAGYSNSTGTHGGYDGWVVRTDKHGDSLWTKYIGTSNWDFFYDVAPTWDGGFVLAGGTYGAGAGDEDMYLVKINSVGDTLWTKTYGGILFDEAAAVCQTKDSMLAVCGFTKSLGDTLGDSWLLRLDSVGNTVWSHTLNEETNEDKAMGIADLGIYNQIMMVGETSSGGDPDAYHCSFRYDGSFNYIDTSGNVGVDFFSGIAIHPNGTFAVLGSTETLGGGNGDMWFFHNRSTWFSTAFGTLATEQGYSIDLAHDDGYIACGYTTGFNSHLPNVYLVKIDTNGVSTGVLGIREELAQDEVAAGSAFPNPASEEVNLYFDSKNAIEGKLLASVYDISGRQVLNIPSSDWQMNSAKAASCKIETTSLADGIYQFIVFDSTGAKFAGKFIIAH